MVDTTHNHPLPHLDKNYGLLDVFAYMADLSYHPQWRWLSLSFYGLVMTAVLNIIRHPSVSYILFVTFVAIVHSIVLFIWQFTAIVFNSMSPTKLDSGVALPTDFEFGQAGGSTGVSVTIMWYFETLQQLINQH